MWYVAFNPSDPKDSFLFTNTNPRRVSSCPLVVCQEYRDTQPTPSSIQLELFFHHQSSIVEPISVKMPQDLRCTRLRSFRALSTTLDVD